MQDVKARYYAIARKLLDVRGRYSDEELTTMPLYRFQYDKGALPLQVSALSVSERSVLLLLLQITTCDARHS